MPIFRLRWAVAGLLLWLGASTPYLHQHALTTQPARLGAELRAPAQWGGLPAPLRKTVVAVYKFRDQTGQYKPQVNGASFSTAVTQGATTMLIRALEDSQWFEPIERENLGNLLNERKIIRSTRQEYTEQTGQKQPNLPSLLFAGVILEGGIISCDANIITGGAGLRYFGAGASGQYQQDGFLTVTGHCRSLLPTAARYRYELSLLRESAGGRSQNTQRGEFDVAPEQEVSLSRARVNASAQDTYRVHLRVLDLTGHVVAQGSAVQVPTR